MFKPPGSTLQLDLLLEEITRDQEKQDLKRKVLTRLLLGERKRRPRDIYHQKKCLNKCGKGMANASKLAFDKCIYLPPSPNGIQTGHMGTASEGPSSARFPLRELVLFRAEKSRKSRH